MYKLIVLLEVIRARAKDLHYILKGHSFYGNHLLADRVQEDLGDFIDQIKETYFMARQLDIPRNETIYADVVKELDNMKEYSILELAEKVKLTIYFIETMLRDTETPFTAGDNDLIGRISSNLQTSYALLSHVSE